jgi:hypothetical protein
MTFKIGDPVIVDNSLKGTISEVINEYEYRISFKPYLKTNIGLISSCQYSINKLKLDVEKIRDEKINNILD